jgi:hypothetical protein
MLQSIERAQPTGEWVVVSRYALTRKAWRNANHQIGELVLISPLISRLAPEIGIDSARNTRVFLARSSEIGDRRSFYGPWAVMESLRNPERTRTARWLIDTQASRFAARELERLWMKLNMRMATRDYARQSRGARTFFGSRKKSLELGKSTFNGNGGLANRSTNLESPSTRQGPPPESTPSPL